MNKKKIVSFPHIGSYYIPLKIVVEKILKMQCLISDPITCKTIQLGSKHSPDFVCTPFKYNLGSMIEQLEQKSNVILQAGGGCRYGYYADLQEKILKDLGYKFEMVKLFDKKKGDKTNSIIYIFKKLKQLNKTLSFFKYSYYGLLCILMIIYMDKINKIINKRRCYEIIPESFNSTRKQLHTELLKCNGYIGLFTIIFKYIFKFKKIKINKPKNKYKIGIVGELYTLMDEFANCDIENDLNKLGISVTRYIDLTNLIIFNKTNPKKLFRKKNKYLKYHLGATGTYTIYKALEMKNKKYDGIIHLKSFGCTPEINAMPILNKISMDNNIPILYLSFDVENSSEAMKTRIEAFVDMIKMRRENDK